MPEQLPPPVDAKPAILSEDEIVSHFQTDDFEELIASLSELQEKGWEGIPDENQFGGFVTVDHLLSIARHVPLIAKGNLPKIPAWVDDTALGLVPIDAYDFRDCVKRCIQKEIEKNT
jgi:hypothetical protein